MVKALTMISLPQGLVTSVDATKNWYFVLGNVRLLSRNGAYASNTYTRWKLGIFISGIKNQVNYCGISAPPPLVGT